MTAAFIASKPRHLYHGSVKRGLSVLRSQAGCPLFATSSVTFALTFLIDAPFFCGWMRGGPSVVIEGNYADWGRRDEGGELYLVPSDTFVPAAGKPERAYPSEWIATGEVRPLASIRYESTLAVLNAYRIPVRFCGRGGLSELTRAGSGWPRVLAGLRPMSRLCGDATLVAS
jgi:hypothetical protein